METEPMLTKVIVIIVMLFILYSLGSGLYYLMKDKGDSTRTVKALTWRIGISLALFIFLLLGYYFGWLQPHGIGVGVSP